MIKATTYNSGRLAANCNDRHTLNLHTGHRRAEVLARQAQHTDLSCGPDFQMMFTDSMIFPETD